MQTYRVRLESPVSTSFRCQKAADSLDINTREKSIHELEVDADITTPFNVGLIVGASGSGKSTLARSIWGEDALTPVLELGRPVIEQFPAEWSYDECAAALTGVGLTSVPCWIRPAETLSNGQRARAEAALALARFGDSSVVIDEWTSVVDRTVAKAMSHCIQKHARRASASVVLVSCHYDVVEWLNPDWIIDCNTQRYTDRRSLWRGFERSEKLTFEVAEVDRSTWPMFAKYHYLSGKLPPGKSYHYGLFSGMDQIGYTCYTNYTPPEKGKPWIFHGNRTVIHPDYVGLGLGIMLINASAAHLHTTQRVRIMGKFSSAPLHRAMAKDPNWKFRGTKRPLGRERGYGARLQRGKESFRRNVCVYLYEFAPSRTT